MNPRFLCLNRLISAKTALLVGILILLIVIRSYIPLEFISSRKTPEPLPVTSTFQTNTPTVPTTSTPAAHKTYVNVVSQPSPRLSIETVKPDAQACRIPRLSVIAPGTADEEDGVYAPQCYNTETLRFRVDFHNNLVRLKPNDQFWMNASCFYKPVIRKPDMPDFNYETSNVKHPMQNDSIKLASDLEHIHVWCSEDGSKVYEDYLSAVQTKPQLEKELSSRFNGKEHYSVMIIGQDSTSNKNFQRRMPKSFEYLVNQMGAVEFSGFNSLGPGTLWSVFALYTGLDLNQYRDLCWPGEMGYRDNCPHIWKDFEARGYRTGYDEDELKMGIFNEKGKAGFAKSQFHYDFRTVSNLLGGVHKGHSSGSHCYGSRLSFSVLTENMCRMATTFHDKPFWSFMWAQSLSHTSNKLVKFSERSMLSSLKYLNENQLLNSTILIIFSDHGARYGSFRRNTRQGFLEERLPVLYIVLPDKFKRNYPLASRNLRENAEKLTTAFDVYEMMKDLLNLTQITHKRLKERAEEKSVETRRNVSLFLPINPNRTCAMIGFAFIYCACLNRQPVPTSDTTVLKATAFVLDAINKNLSSYNECHQLQMKNITQAFNLGLQISRKDELDRFGMRPEETDRAVGENFEIGLETQPGKGVYDISVLKNGNGDFKMEDVSRVTEYGHDADCMPVKALRPFCTCKA